MTSIDLTPPERIVRRVARVSLRRWGTRIGMVVLVVTLSYVGLVRLAAARGGDLQMITVRYAALQGRLQKAESLIAERDNLARHREAISLIRNEQTAAWYMELIGGFLTADSFLTSLTLDLCAYSDSKIWGTLNKEECGPSLRIMGHARGHQQVGQIIGGMNASGIFGEVDLISIQGSDDTGSSRGVDFEMLCTIPPDDGRS